MLKKRTALILLMVGIPCFLRSELTLRRVFFPDGETLLTEVAETDEDRARGLMFRKSLNDDQGMLFVFEVEGLYSFWMKNMNFPLDILWLDRQKRIVHIVRAVPPCEKEPCPSYVTEFPAKYVLELKAGSVEKRKLKLYDRIDFIL